MPGHSTEIANEFLKAALDKFTQMQLQKLVYLAHGWSLAVLDQPLVTDQPQAWEYGPVYRDLYVALRKYGSRPITALIRFDDFLAFNPEQGDIASAKLSKLETAVIDQVIKTYGDFPAFKLSALTHEKNTPWWKVFNEEGQNKNIPNELIKQYFSKFVHADQH